MRNARAKRLRRETFGDIAPTFREYVANEGRVVEVGVQGLFRNKKKAYLKKRRRGIGVHDGLYLYTMAIIRKQK